MTWATELAKIRRYLRDPDGAIWTEAFLRHCWNDVQQDFVHRTRCLERAVAQRVPGLYQGSYLFDWEARHLAVDRSYQALTLHSEYVVCAPWEAQEVAGIASDAPSQGAHFTHPWEGHMSDPGDPIRMRWPRDLNELQYIAYDNEAITATSKKVVQSRDSSYLSTSGTPSEYYQWDQDSFVLYPRPSTAWANEIDGSAGVAWYADGDTEDVTTGTVALRTGSSDDGEGASVDLIDSADNLLMVYRASPTEVANTSDDPDIPEFLRKYVRCGVIGRAYSANTDGRIRSLGDLWDARYQLGVELAKRWMRNRRQDRDYRLTSAPARRKGGHPKLPDTYPAI